MRAPAISISIRPEATEAISDDALWGGARSPRRSPARNMAWLRARLARIVDAVSPAWRRQTFSKPRLTPQRRATAEMFNVGFLRFQQGSAPYPRRSNSAAVVDR